MSDHARYTLQFILADGKHIDCPEVVAHSQAEAEAFALATIGPTMGFAAPIVGVWFVDSEPVLLATPETRVAALERAMVEERAKLIHSRRLDAGTPTQYLAAQTQAFVELQREGLLATPLAERTERTERTELALRALVRHEPLYARYLADDDISILQCVYCAGMEEGDVFLHIPPCPWLRAKALLATPPTATNDIIASLRAALKRQAERHGEPLPLVYFYGILGDEV